MESMAFEDGHAAASGRHAEHDPSFDGDAAGNVNSYVTQQGIKAHGISFSGRGPWLPLRLRGLHGLPGRAALSAATQHRRNRNVASGRCACSAWGYRDERTEIGRAHVLTP